MRATVNLFDVTHSEETPPLSATMLAFEGLPLESRWRGDIRLEHIERRDLDGVPAFFLDLARRRDTGPGKLREHTALEHIGMDEDEAFGEETAALYIPRKKWLLVLNNASGIGATRMMGYFNAVDPGRVQHDYTARPKIDAGTAAKLARLDRATSIQVSATVDALSASDREMGVGLARAASAAGGRTLTFTISARERHQRNGVLDLGVVRGFLDRLQGQQGVAALKVKGHDPESDRERDQMIDLIRHRVRLSFGENELEIAHRRYTLASRWRLLERAFRSWHHTL